MNESTTNMRTEEAIKEKIKESRFESINGKDLMEMDLPPLHYTISTILPHGLVPFYRTVSLSSPEVLKWVNRGLPSRYPTLLPVEGKSGAIKPYSPRSCISVWKIP